MNRVSRPIAGAILLFWLTVLVVTMPLYRAHAAPTPAPTPAAAPSAAPAKKAADDSNPEAKLNNVIQAMGTIQSYLEFYYMQAGIYPDALEDMLTQYNQAVRNNEKLVEIPTDPATGNKFLYTPSADRTAYTLKAPAPAAYGQTSLEVHQVAWGWMATVAHEQRIRRMTVRCAQIMELLSDEINQYNQTHRNKYPDTLDELLPKYLQKLPTCPLSKKPYIYEHTDRGFVIRCPDPKVHGEEVFEYEYPEGGLKKQP